MVISLCYVANLAAAPLIPVTVYIESKYALDSYVNGKSAGESLAIATSVPVLNNAQLDISYVYSSKKKTLAILDSGANACVVNKLRTAQRIERYLFSNPISLYYSQRLYYSDPSLKNHRMLFNTDGEVDLIKLFELFPNKTLMLKANTSYGDKLDRVLSQVANKNKRFLSENMPQLKLFEMLAHQRSDFIISYPLVKAKTAKDAAITYGSLIANTNQYALGRIMCSNTPVMVTVIAELNKFHQADHAQFELDYRREFK